MHANVFLCCCVYHTISELLLRQSHMAIYIAQKLALQELGELPSAIGR
jgi:hypothetical protein